MARNSFTGPFSTVLTDGRKVVTTAATRVQLGTTQCSTVMIQAETDNTGKIAVGGATVVALVGTTATGINLEPGDVITVEADTLADIYLDSTVSGDGVRYVVSN